jgi:hypothetical protein
MDARIKSTEVLCFCVTIAPMLPHASIDDI